MNDPWSMAAGDFNNDQKLDLIITNGHSKSVSLLLGDGTGGFSSTSRFSVAPIPLWVAVGDFNLDGKLDAAVNADRKILSVLLGDGKGGFDRTTEFSVEKDSEDIAVSDFNLDGKPDLAISVGNIALSVLLGDGSGKFGPAKTFFLSGDFPLTDSCVTTADFNLDGKPDLAVSISHRINGRGTSILLGDGLGNFSVSDRVDLITIPAMLAGDFNQDGKPDLVGYDSDRAIGFAWGDGTGSFRPFDSFPFLAGSGDGFAIADFNEDLTPDLVISSKTAWQGMSILLNGGPGGFSSFQLDSGAMTHNFAIVGDFNNDTRPDIAVEDHGGNQVIVFLGLGRSTPP